MTGRLPCVSDEAPLPALAHVPDRYVHVSSLKSVRLMGCEVDGVCRRCRSKPVLDPLINMIGRSGGGREMTVDESLGS